MDKENKEQINQFVIENGLSDYKWIDTSKIVVANWVRMKCMYGCNGYGMGACPPNVPPVEDCRKFVNEYSDAILFRLKVMADKDDYPSGWAKEMTEKLLAIEKRVFLNGNYKAFLLNHSCSSYCDDCSKSRIDCNNKRKARPSAEGMAIDVYHTVRSCGYDINVVSESKYEITRYAFLLVE